MSSTESDPEEGITREEMADTAVPGLSKASSKRNAFTELMAPKHKTSSSSPPKSKHHPPRGGVFKNRDALGAYLADPAAFPPSIVVFHTEAFVAIHDRFPKATVHCLLLPRAAAVSCLSPFEALADAEFLAAARADAARLKTLVAQELRRQLGAYSAAEAARQAVLRGDDDDDEGTGEEAGKEKEGAAKQLPPGRDWEAEVRVGIHAHPSMSHLHIHVLSRDMHSASLKHRKHYNSFNTPFFVPLADFPLAADDPRRHPGREDYMGRPLICWRCGRDFGNRFKELKDHLEEEFEAWKRG